MKVHLSANIQEIFLNILNLYCRQSPLRFSFSLITSRNGVDFLSGYFSISNLIRYRVTEGCLTP